MPSSGGRGSGAGRPRYRIWSPSGTARSSAGCASVRPVDPDIAPGAEELPAPRPTAGELLALYVAPALTGTGVGRALMAAATARARAHGFHTLYLWVVRGNTRAERFYERAGFAPDGAEEAYDVGGSSVPELRYRRALAPTAG